MVRKKITEEIPETPEIIEDTEDIDEIDVPVDGEAEFFPDGPTLNMVEGWRSRYKNIFATEFDDETFIWRTITRFEYKDLLKVKNADALYREERICERCVLWPEDYSFVSMSGGKAGIPSIISEQIMEKSGFAAGEPLRI